MKKISLQTSWLVLPLILALLIIWPMFRPGFWKSDDGEWMVIRFAAFHQSFRDGQFPVRWLQNLNRGYGYPVTNFLYPLPFYLAEAPRLLGAGFSASIEIVFALSIVFAGLGMFAYARKWGNSAAVLAASIYLFAPYRLFLTYTRGSLGESVALAFVPWLFLLADKLASGRKRILNLSLLAAAYAALILSHNVVALLFTPILIFYFFKNSLPSKRRLLWQYALALVLGLAFSAFFWLPALAELRYTRDAGLVIADYDRYLLTLSGLLEKAGIIPLVIVVLAIFKRKFFFPLIALTAVFLTHRLAAPVDDLIPFLGKIQFPWRLLTVFMFASAAAAAQLLHELRMPSGLKKPLVILISALLFFQTLPELSRIDYVNRDQGFYSTNDDTTTVRNEFTPIWVKTNPQNRPESFLEIEADPGTYQIIDQDSKTGDHYLQLRLESEVTLNYRLHYFPGWEIFVDGQKQEFDPASTDGLVSFKLTPGNTKLRTVKLVFGKTEVRKIAELVSSTTIFIAGLAVLFYAAGRKKFLRLFSLSVFSFFLLNLAYFVFTNLTTYRENFAPQELEKAYLNSQWVNPYGNNVPIGDSGLYQWAGWRYIHGENPVLINPEMPPLGKYLIGLGLVTVGKPALIGFSFVGFALVSLYFFSRLILKNSYLALLVVALFGFEPLMTGLLNTTMLDALQLGFLNLTFFGFIKGLDKPRWFLLSSLMLGGVISTKFYSTGLLVAGSLVAYLVIRKQFRELVRFSCTLPLVGLVHLGSYSAYLAHGNSLRDYLGVQKWIYDFYRQGNVGTVPPGSYWLLVLFNRWRVWFGQEWGKYTTIQSDLWRITWPLNFLAFAASLTGIFRKIINPQEMVLLTWLSVYSLFLTFIIGWPHYLVLFLPYSYILLVKLVYQTAPGLANRLTGLARRLTCLADRLIWKK